MDVTMLLAALALGFAARAVGLPPLVGYLLAGFGLHAAGLQSTPTIDAAAELGVLMLLFGIGLKLRLRTLAQPVVWGTASAFAVISTTGIAAAMIGLGALGLPMAGDLSPSGALVIAFALSFCSTVFAVKALERANESQSLAGRIAVGVLVVQDLLAVGFLVALGGMPSWWALVVVPVIVAVRPLLRFALDRTDHGELLVLFGVALAVGLGAESFAAVGLKPDLGALVLGVLLSSHPRSVELAGRLMDIKDLLLVGFFLSIGLTGTPSLTAWGVGLGMLVLLPLRTGLLLWLLTRFRLRSRTALAGSLTLSTYSEFGLIVGTAAVGAGLIGEEWVSTIAVALGLSLVLASIASGLRYRMVSRFGELLSKLERAPTLKDDAVIDISDAAIIVFGMGRVGTGAYDELRRLRGPVVLGVDHNDLKVLNHLSAGREVVRGNALDRDFWERVRMHEDVELVLASMGTHAANLECVRRIREFLPDARIASIATYADQIVQLEAAGVDVARNLYEEAGQALADDTIAAVYGTTPDR